MMLESTHLIQLCMHCNSKAPAYIVTFNRYRCFAASSAPSWQLLRCSSAVVPHAATKPRLL